MKRSASLLLALLFLVTLCAPAFAADGTGDEIVILHTNDVHTYIDKPLGYATVAALKKAYQAQGKNVLVVDAGDFIQGTAYATADKGQAIVRFMNEAGYDLATFGNHEFDYGRERTYRLLDEADFPIVCCNLFRVENGRRAGLLTDAYKVFTFGNTRVAIVGVLTPTTITSSGAPLEAAEIGGAGNPQELYELMQAAADAARKEADYVIALAHLGEAADGVAVSASVMPYTLQSCLANVTGFDAVIDGHSHTVNPGSTIPDKSGKQIPVVQTGCYFSYIGQTTIRPDGTIRTELLNFEDPAEYRDPAVQASLDAYIGKIRAELGETIAETETTFSIYDPDGVRQVRRQETNLADLATDSVYWYVNDHTAGGCDVVFMNGGGVRTTVDAGAWSSLTCSNVLPFGNNVCLAEIPGQLIVEALEFGARFTPAQETGSFLQASGLSYEIHTYVPSTVQLTDAGAWAGPPTGARRVRNVRIYDRETGVYAPLDPDKLYRVGITDYLILNLGDGYRMFNTPEINVLANHLNTDSIMLTEYVRAFADESGNGLPDLTTAASPLAALPGFLLNYERLFGSRRITLYEQDPREIVWGSLLITSHRPTPAPTPAPVFLIPTRP